MYDIVFLHPPSSFTKLRYPLSGAFGGSVVSSDLLAFEPVGMISMAWDLSRRGYRTRIFNVGRMLLDLRHQGATGAEAIEKFIAGLESKIYAVGLHWAVHAPGTIELAKLIKAHHPDRKVILGGITSTYFHEEIMDTCPFVDLVVLGEVDGLIHEIVDGLLNESAPEAVTNICYRENGRTATTRLTPPKKRGLYYLRGAADELIVPNTSFSRVCPRHHRVALIPLIHGCPLNCPFCGGSRSFYRRHFGRDRAEAMSIDDALTNVLTSISQGAVWIKFYGDPRLFGGRYWQELVHALRREQLSVGFTTELFAPAAPEYLAAWRSVTSGGVTMTMSPESGDPRVRQSLGKAYTNDDIAQQVALAMSTGITMLLGFMMPLPHQDFASIAKTQDFVSRLCYGLGTLVDHMVEPFLFMDPGSPIFDVPEQFGYHIPDHTLAGIVKGLTRPHWSYAVNYATNWLSKEEIVDAIFAVGQWRCQLERAFKGPSQRNVLHEKLIHQQKTLVRILRKSPDLADEQIEKLIERTIDRDLRQMNFSVTNPAADFDNVYGLK